MSVKRVFVEKKPEYAIKARELREEIESYLDITEVTGVRVLVRYDIENISEDVYKEALGTIFPSRRSMRCSRRHSRMARTTWYSPSSICLGSSTRELILRSSV